MNFFKIILIENLKVEKKYFNPLIAKVFLRFGSIPWLRVWHLERKIEQLIPIKRNLNNFFQIFFKF